ncbi:MAG: hypothetical protein ABIQ16_14345 [Polyangiaceae bacterium]
MFTCERCGAVLPADRDQCAYCGTLSAAARGALQAAAAVQAHEQARHAAQVAIARHTLLSSTEQAASKALMWGLLSFVFFCLPIFNVLSFLQFKKAQSTAREAGVPLPTRATVGLFCSATTLLCCVGSWVWMITDIRADSARVEARKGELAKQIATHPMGPALDQPFACALAEQYVLTNGFQNETNTGSFRDVDCAGAVRIVSGRAEMPDFKFKPSSSGAQQSATICFKLGERWFVERAQATGCDLK